MQRGQQSELRPNQEWHAADNASLYDEFTKTFPLYKDIAQRLIRHADLRDGMTILDLACGTGIVSRTVLQTVSVTRLILVDMSEEMMHFARRNVRDERCTYEIASAETVADCVEENSVDVALCSAAIWKMDVDAVLRQLRSILKPGGRFVFNTGEYRSRVRESLDGRTYRSSQRVPGEAERAVRESGWHIVAASEHVRRNLREEYCHFAALPAMAARHLDGVELLRLSYAERVASLRTAIDQGRRRWPSTSVWLYYSACPSPAADAPRAGSGDAS